MSSDFERYADPLDLAASLAMIEVESARAKAAISAEKGRGLPAPSLQCVWCQEEVAEGKHFCDAADDDCEQMWVKRQEHHKKLHRKG
jgi:hypothetical protein